MSIPSYVTLANRCFINPQHPDYKWAMQIMQETVEKLNAKTGLSLQLHEKEPLIFFSKSTKGGYVWPTKWGNRVFLNYTLLKENKEKDFETTIKHEVAHLFQRVLSPYETSHGPTWKRMMNFAGLNAVRCHSYGIANAGRSKTIKYKCNCRTFDITIAIHTKICCGQTRRCTKCKVNLVRVP